MNYLNITTAANTNKSEFVQLINQNQGLIHKVCHMYCNNPDNRQDLFQEIVIQLWKAFPSFRQEAKFSTWMYRVAINTAISDIRRQKNRIRGIGIENIADEIQDEEYNREKEEQLRQLYSAIGQLSPIEKALVMLYLEDKSYDEMEDILGINQNNLRVKMNRVKEKLRKLTTQEED